MEINFLKIILIKNQLKELNIHYFVEQQYSISNANMLKNQILVEDVILAVDTATKIR
jgi:hypothetical protein